MKKDIEIYKEYCAGCGLCHSIENVTVEEKNGFLCPNLSDRNSAFCDVVCPANGNHVSMINKENPWGRYILAKSTWSEDIDLRFRASSGGTLSALSIFLLDTHRVDGIIQVKADEQNPIRTICTVSSSAGDVKACAGSRYVVSNPLLNIRSIVESDKRYAFIGKPCDVLALKNYLSIDKALQHNIVLLLSFFCAGVPSRNANCKLLKGLGTTEENCISLNYRGNGWPGYATAVTNDGTEKTMTYNDSWGRILGRDINHFCRFCMDGIGEFADIACGDAWYMNSDSTPDFTEHDGRNITFARSEKGKDILVEASRAGYIHIEDYDIDELKYIQSYQYSRRSQIYSRIIGLKFCGRNTPKYSIKMVKKLASDLSLKSKIRITLGTIKRVMKGNM